MKLLAETFVMSDAGINYLMNLEGLRLQPYADGNGYSIGYGHLIKQGEEWMLNGITKQQAGDIFMSDLAMVENAVGDTITAQVARPYRDALMMFAYNIGWDNFRTSQLAALTNDDNVTDAQIQSFWATTWVGSPPKQVLLDRRKNEIWWAYNGEDEYQFDVTKKKANYWWLVALVTGTYIYSKS